MITIKAMSIAAVAALSLMSAASFAQSVTATSLTMEGAEAKIVAQAQQQGAQYKIIEASNGNVVHMTAVTDGRKRKCQERSPTGGLFCI